MKHLLLLSAMILGSMHASYGMNDDEKRQEALDHGLEPAVRTQSNYVFGTGEVVQPVNAGEKLQEIKDALARNPDVQTIQGGNVQQNKKNGCCVIS